MQLVLALMGDRMPLAQLTVLSWAGMRGVVSLAAAIALPLDFPERELIVFCAILATLVVQGTRPGWLIRRLGLIQLPPNDGLNPQEARLCQQTAEAMLRAIERRADDLPYGPIAQDLLAEHGIAGPTWPASRGAGARHRPSAPPAAPCGWKGWRRPGRAARTPREWRGARGHADQARRGAGFRGESAAARPGQTLYRAP